MYYIIKISHPLGRTSRPSFSQSREVNSINTAALEIYRRGFAIDCCIARRVPSLQCREDRLRNSSEGVGYLITRVKRLFQIIEPRFSITSKLSPWYCCVVGGIFELGYMVRYVELWVVYE